MLVVSGLDKSNGERRCVVANRGCGSDDGLCGGNPLRMADRLDDISWCGVCETRWWWVRGVKPMVAVTVFVPRGSCDRVDG